MTVIYPEAECWFLTGSQSLYGPETLGKVAEQSQRLVEQLNAAGLPARVTWKPVLIDSAGIQRMCHEANGDPRCIGVIVWMHTFSPAKAWIAGLLELRKPLLHLHTQANLSLPWSTIDMDFMNLNQAAHGDREFGYMAARLGLRRKIVVGHVSDPSVHGEIETWQRAAAGYHDLRTARFARFGDTMRNVAVTDGDRVEAQIHLGTAIETYGVWDLAQAVSEVSEGDVDKLCAEYADCYELAPELLRGGERHESLRYAARLELGLRAFLHDGGFAGFTTSFEDLGPLRQLPGIAVQRLMYDGFGFGAEGDWKTALLVRAAKTMARGRSRGTSFMEDYTYHLGPGDQLILGAHMLEVCPSLTSQRPRCEIHPLLMGNREDPVRLVFTADPGPAVVAGLCDMGDHLRMVANTIDLVEPPEPLPRLPVARALWRPRPDLRTSARRWIAAGGPHHTVLSAALSTRELQDFADMAEVEFIVVDGDTAGPTT
ncbi:MAG: L-arabinose isomerase [Acidothermus sp.]|nr:L-arabinose isomerase [Acidothermus sp.]